MKHIFMTLLLPILSMTAGEQNATTPKVDLASGFLGVNALFCQKK